MVGLHCRVFFSEYWANYRCSICLPYELPPLLLVGLSGLTFPPDHNSLLIYGSLRKPTLDRFSLVTHYSTGISLAMCLIMAFAGFLTFGSNTKGNVLNNFPADNIMVNIARL